MEKLKPSYTAGRIVNGAAALKNSLAFTQKVEHRITIWPSNSTPRYTPKGIENRCSQKNVYMNVHSNIIYDSHKVKAIQIPTN